MILHWAFSSWDVSAAFEMGMKTWLRHHIVLWERMSPSCALSSSDMEEEVLHQSEEIFWSLLSSPREPEDHLSGSPGWKQLPLLGETSCFPRSSLSRTLLILLTWRLTSSSLCGTSVLCPHTEEMAVTKAEESPALEPSWRSLCTISQLSWRARKHLRTKEVLFLWEFPVSLWTWIL